MSESKCIKGDCINGKGTLSLSDGRKYIGQFKNGEFNGEGILTFPEVMKYEGQFVDGEFNGEGILTFSDGMKYEGQFVGGIYHGIGVQTFSDGEKYEGQFKYGEFNGFGIQTFPNGIKYEGLFRNSRLVGEGILTSLDGTTYKGQFVDGKFLEDSDTTYSDDRNVFHQTEETDLPESKYSEIICQIRKFLFEDAEDGYAVAKVKLAGRTDVITVTGNLLSHYSGDTCKMKGYWYDHAKYGSQFRVVECEDTFPEDQYDCEDAFPEDQYDINYDEYIQSELWRQTRLFALQRCGNLCENCGAKGRKYQMYVHHLSYSNLRKEGPEDLICLCSSCHEIAHTAGSKVMRNFIGDDDPTASRWCFIATVVYGSADCMEVKMLREFRDKNMMSCSLGRHLVSYYYKFAPYFANYIKNKVFLKFFIRKILNNVIVIINYFSQKNIFDYHESI